MEELLKECKEYKRGIVKGLDIVLDTFCVSELSPETRKRINFMRLKLMKSYADNTKAETATVDHLQRTIRGGAEIGSIPATQMEEAPKGEAEKRPAMRRVYAKRKDKASQDG